jgi:thiol-disulfide isomerase/thioredoxin
MRVRSSIAVLLSFLALLAATAQAAPENSPDRRLSGGLSVGALPPALALTRISGEDAVTLQGLHGRVVILDFWATWCTPCRAVMPVLDDMNRRHRGAGLSIVGMSPESESAIRSHLGAEPVGYTIARDVGGTMQRYGVRAIPTMVVLDRNGQVREVIVGMDSSGISRLESLVVRLLAERPR